MKQAITLFSLFLAITSIQLDRSEEVTELNNILSSVERLLPLINSKKVEPSITHINELSNIFLPESRYDKCLVMMEKANKDMIDILQKIFDNNWRESIPLVEDFSVTMYDLVMCFCKTNGLENGYLNVDEIEDLDSRKDCIMKHLREACSHIKNALKALFRRQWKKFKSEMNIACNVLKDIKHC